MKEIVCTNLKSFYNKEKDKRCLEMTFSNNRQVKIFIEKNYMFSSRFSEGDDHNNLDKVTVYTREIGKYIDKDNNFIELYYYDNNKKEISLILDTNTPGITTMPDIYSLIIDFSGWRGWAEIDVVQTTPFHLHGLEPIPCTIEVSILDDKE